MKKKFKIGIAYYEDINLGDVIIHDSVVYLLDEIKKKNNFKYEIVDIDIGNKHLDTVTFSFKDRVYNKIMRKVYAILRRIFKDNKNIIIKQWNLTKYHKYIKDNAFQKMKDVDMVIFAGGGLIKFHKQKFHFVINDVTKYADDHNIPVIFNACGVEGYDESNTRCNILKNALNRKCVKAISTRDDIDLLREKYVENDIDTELVADSAVYTSETYGIKKKKDAEYVGICVIRPEIFKDYLYEVDEEVLLEMYSDTIKKLQKKKYPIKIFTNGADSDEVFIWKLKEYMNADDSFDEMVEPKSTKAEELVNIIAQCKMVIGARLHSNIVAYALNVPVISIVWNNKQLMFSRINHIEEYFVTKENFNSDYIMKCVESIDKQKPIEKKYKQSVYNYLEKQIKKILYSK